MTVTILAPSFSGTDPVKTPAPSTGRSTPFALTVTGVASVTVPFTVMLVCFVKLLVTGLLTVSTGCWVSRFTVRVESVRFPTASTADTVRRLLPSVARRTLAE